MGQREAKAGFEELLDVGPANVVGLGELNNTEDLEYMSSVYRHTRNGANDARGSTGNEHDGEQPCPGRGP